MFICSRLDLPGGIERAIVNTANLLDSKGNKVSLIILDETAASFYPLHSDINVLSQHLHLGITTKGNLLTRKLAFYRHIEKLKKLMLPLDPDIVIATEYPFSIAARLALKKTITKVYSWEHHHFNHLQKSTFWQVLMKKLYPKLTGVICLNKDEAKGFEAIGCKTIVIPNFVVKADKEPATLESKQLLTVGWLSKTKGADLIPAIASIVFAKHPDWKWKVIGEGEELKSIQRTSANIEAIKPYSYNIAQAYLDSSLYILPSRFECFPMVLLEAMSVGLPAVAFDCPTGPRHIIQNSTDGLLVEKEEIKAMADAVIRLIENQEKRKQLGANAFQNIQRFSSDAVYKLWEHLLHGQ